jgi:hypothetical protein
MPGPPGHAAAPLSGAPPAREGRSRRGATLDSETGVKEWAFRQPGLPYELGTPVSEMEAATVGVDWRGSCR